MLISSTKTVCKQLQINKNSSGEAQDYGETQQKPYRAQSPRMAAQKNVGSILPASPPSEIQSSGHQERSTGRDFTPQRKGGHEHQQHLLPRIPRSQPVDRAAQSPYRCVSSRSSGDQSCCFSVTTLWGSSQAWTPSNQGSTADAYAFSVIVADPGPKSLLWPASLGLSCCCCLSISGSWHEALMGPSPGSCYLLFCDCPLWIITHGCAWAVPLQLCAPTQRF